MDVHLAAGRPDLQKPQFSFRKTSILEKKRPFASTDDWDRLLRPPLDVLEPLEGARGSGSTHLVSIQKKLLTPKVFLKTFVEASRSASSNHCIFTVSKRALPKEGGAFPKDGGAISPS